MQKSKVRKITAFEGPLIKQKRVKQSTVVDKAIDGRSLQIIGENYRKIV